MICPACNGEESVVLRTRNMPDRIARRRRCLACRHDWTTEELSSSRVKKLDAAVAIIDRLVSVSKELSHGTA